MKDSRDFVERVNPKKSPYSDLIAVANLKRNLKISKLRLPLALPSQKQTFSKYLWTEEMKKSGLRRNNSHKLEYCVHKERRYPSNGARIITRSLLKKLKLESIYIEVKRRFAPPEMQNLGQNYVVKI